MAIDFEASSSQEIRYSTGTDLSNLTALTVGCFVKAESFNSFPFAFSNWGPAGNGWVLYRNSSAGQIEFSAEYDDSGSTDTGAGDDIALAEYYFIGATWTTTGITVFVGEAGTSATAAFTAHASTRTTLGDGPGTMVIGGFDGSGDYWDGLLTTPFLIAGQAADVSDMQAISAGSMVPGDIVLDEGAKLFYSSYATTSNLDDEADFGWSASPFNSPTTSGDEPDFGGGSTPVDVEQPATIAVALTSISGGLNASQLASQPATVAVSLTPASGTLSAGSALYQPAVVSVALTPASGAVKANQAASQPATVAITLSTLAGVTTVDTGAVWTRAATVDLQSYETLAGTPQTCGVAFPRDTVPVGSTLRAYYVTVEEAKVYIAAQFDRPISWGALEVGTDYIHNVEASFIWPDAEEVIVEFLPPGESDPDPQVLPEWELHEDVNLSLGLRLSVPALGYFFNLVQSNAQQTLDGDTTKEFQWFTHTNTDGVPTEWACRCRIRVYSGSPIVHVTVQVTRGIALVGATSSSPSYVRNRNFDRRTCSVEFDLESLDIWDGIEMDSIAGLSNTKIAHGEGLPTKTFEINFTTGAISEYFPVEQPRGIRDIRDLPVQFGGPPVPEWMEDPSAVCQDLAAEEFITYVPFDATAYFVPHGGQAGDQGRFGVNHIHPDIHGGGWRAGSWRKQVYNVTCRPGHYVFSDGSLVTDEDFPLAELYRGTTFDTRSGPDWMDRTTSAVGGRAPGESEVEFPPPTHWGITHVTQPYLFYRDSGLQWEVESISQAWLFACPMPLKTLSGVHNNGAPRARGRSLQAGADLYWSLTEDALRRKIRERIRLKVADQYARWLANISSNGHPLLLDGGYWSVWMHGLWFTGLRAARGVLEGHHSTEVGYIDTMLDYLGTWVTSWWIEWPAFPGSGLRIPYEVFPPYPGTHNPTPPNLTTTHVWALLAVQAISPSILSSSEAERRLAVLNQHVFLRDPSGEWEEVESWVIGDQATDLTQTYTVLGTLTAFSGAVDSGVNPIQPSVPQVSLESFSGTVDRSQHLHPTEGEEPPRIDLVPISGGRAHAGHLYQHQVVQITMGAEAFGTVKASSAVFQTATVVISITPATVDPTVVNPLNVSQMVHPIEGDEPQTLMVIPLSGEVDYSATPTQPSPVQVLLQTFDGSVSHLSHIEQTATVQINLNSTEAGPGKVTVGTTIIQPSRVEVSLVFYGGTLRVQQMFHQGSTVEVTMTPVTGKPRIKKQPKQPKLPGMSLSPYSGEVVQNIDYHIEQTRTILVKLQRYTGSITISVEDPVTEPWTLYDHVFRFRRWVDGIRGRT